MIVCLCVVSAGRGRAPAEPGEGGGRDHRQEEALWLAGPGAGQIRSHDQRVHGVSFPHRPRGGAPGYPGVGGPSSGPSTRPLLTPILALSASLSPSWTSWTCSRKSRWESPTESTSRPFPTFQVSPGRAVSSGGARFTRSSCDSAVSQSGGAASGGGPVPDSPGLEQRHLGCPKL